MVYGVVLRAFLWCGVCVTLWGAAPRDSAPSFDVSMLVGVTAQQYEISKRDPSKNYLAFFKYMYDRNNLSKVALSDAPRIPKIIHQIWIGSPLPEKYKKLQKTWLDNHPGWEYRLWTDTDIEALGLVNKVAYDRAPTYASKADIARLEILYRFGGLYVDMDCECIKSFDDLHHAYDLYVGLQSAASGGRPRICNAVIGVKPQALLLQACIKNIDHKRLGYKLLAGSVYFQDMYLKLVNKQDRHTIAFPATFFYPFIARDFHKSGSLPRPIPAETFAMHHFDRSWIGNGGRVTQVKKAQAKHVPARFQKKE